MKSLHWLPIFAHMSHNKMNLFLNYTHQHLHLLNTLKLNFRRSRFANWADLNGEWVDLHETLASSESTFQRNVRVIRKIPVDSDFRSVAPFFEVFSLSFVDSETIP